MTWQKGVPPKSMFVWVKWKPSWCPHELTELAHFNPDFGFEFWGDEPDWNRDKLLESNFLYLPIETPEGGIA